MGEWEEMKDEGFNVEDSGKDQAHRKNPGAAVLFATDDAEL